MIKMGDIYKKRGKNELVEVTRISLAPDTSHVFIGYDNIKSLDKTGSRPGASIKQFKKLYKKIAERDK